jgi:regulator of sigma E protease
MTLVLSALAFLLLLTLLVLVHELGHFAAARWAKVTVEEFGLGLTPRAKKLFTQKGTLFSLNYIPFGGFVRLQGETSLDAEERTREGSFAAASIPARLIILLAGVFMNFVLAIILLVLGFSLWRWIPTYITLDDLRAGAERQEVDAEWGMYVSEVISGGSAEQSGVASGGLLVSVNNVAVTRVQEVLAFQKDAASVRYTLRYPSATSEDRMNFTEEKSYTIPVEEGKTGVALSEFALHLSGKNHSLAKATALAFRETRVVMVQTVRGAGMLLFSLLSHGKVPEGITGIVGIAQLTHASVQEGFMTYLRLVALLSLSLAALNVLPFPALDGGRMLFVLMEMVTGKPVYRRLEVVTNGIGFFFILLLIVAVTLSDILRIFSSMPSL